MRIQTLMGDDARSTEELLPLVNRVFDDFSSDYLTGRLSQVADPALLVALDDNGQPIGFKLGYRRGATLFYSWLGGVDPDGRHRGVARMLLNAQHEWAAQNEYRFVETRTRTNNNAMIILNLKAGFQIVGYDQDQSGIAVVTLRRELRL